MIHYFGGNLYDYQQEAEFPGYIPDTRVAWRMVSFVYHSQWKGLRDMMRTLFKEKPSKKVSLFLDSGAFSAFTKGVEISIQDYIDFIKENKKYIDVYANLDVIGDAEATLKNQRIMEKQGLSPIPCFHYGEPWKYLDLYLSEYDYIAIGGMARVSKRGLHFLDLCFDKICDKEGTPTIKVHGFAITSLKLMLRYPWYSVDSTSWVLTGRMGDILVPQKRNGAYDYCLEPMKVSISARSSSDGTEKHVNNMSPSILKITKEYTNFLGMEIGKSKFSRKPANYELKSNERWISQVENDGTREIETIVTPGLCNNYRLRDQVNIMYFLGLEKQIPPWPNAKFIRKGMRSLL